MPRCLPLAASISSAYRCSGLASDSSLAQSADARSTSPTIARADTSQNEQIVNVPSSPSRPSSVCPGRYRSTSPSLLSSSAMASTVARTRSSSGGRKPISGISSAEASSVEQSDRNA